MSFKEQGKPKLLCLSFAFINQGRNDRFLKLIGFSLYGSSLVEGDKILVARGIATVSELPKLCGWKSEEEEGKFQQEVVLCSNDESAVPFSCTYTNTYPLKRSRVMEGQHIPGAGKDQPRTRTPGIPGEKW